MWTWLLRRLLAMVPTMLGITVLTFLVVDLAPGDPAAASRGEVGGAGASRQADAVRARQRLLGFLELDDALPSWRVVGDQVAPGARLGPLAGRARAVAPLVSGVVVADSAGRITEIDEKGAARVLAHEADGVGALAVAGDALAAGSDGGWVALLRPAARAGRWQVDGAVTALAFLPGTIDLLVGTDAGRVQRVGPGRAMTFSGPAGAVRALAVSPDGHLVAAGGDDRMLRVWDVATGELRRQDRGGGQAITALAISPDGRWLATGGADPVIRVYDLAMLQAAPRQLEGHDQSVTALAWGPQGLWSASRDEAIHLWVDGAVVARSVASTGLVTDLAVTEAGAWSAGECWRRVPVWRRYLAWLGRVARLDFDRSFVDQRPVTEKLARAVPVTVGLNALAILIVYAVSLPLGIVMAVRRGSAFDHLSSVLLFLLYSIPSFWLATLLILTFSSAAAWDLLPSVGLHAPDEQDLSYLQWLWDAIRHLVLPEIVLVYGGFASLSQYARGAMLDTIGQDYVRTARAKGLPELVVILRHAFRNSLVTMVTLLGSLLPALVGGSVIVESIFSIDGMGKLALDAILYRDYPVIMAVTTLSALLTLLGVLLSDLLYGVVNPRVREGAP